MLIRDQRPSLTLGDALALWVDISGIDPATTRTFRWADRSVMEIHRDLKEALDLDDTEITGVLLFEYLVSLYFQERSFTVEELVAEPTRVSNYLEKSKRLLEYLRSDRNNALRTEFQISMRKALTRYEAIRPEVDSLLQQVHLLAILRRDAMRSMARLECHQFLQGTAEPEGYAPVYGKHLYQWWNVNSMLQHMTRMPSGITVNLITHPTDPFRSYFAFVIRNGANLFVFTDREATAHPFAADFERRPDRVLAERAARNWFPYELTGLAFDEDGKAYIQSSDTTALVPYQAEIHPIKALADLAPPVIAWLAMMLDLIVQKFWRKAFQAKQLSYTGEMIKVGTPLLTAAKAAQLPVTGYVPISAKPLTVSQIRDKEFIAPHVGSMGYGAHDWLENRYAHQVTEESLNLLAGATTKLALTFANGQPSLTNTPTKDLEDRFPIWERHKALELQLDVSAMDPTNFGTPEQLEADRVFIARTNYAKQINRLALLEFEARKKEVIRWVRERVLANLPALEAYFAQEDDIYLPAPVAQSFDDTSAGWRGIKNGQSVRQFYQGKSLLGKNAYLVENMLYYFQEGVITLRGNKLHPKGHPACHYSNAPAAWLMEFYPETTEDLAFLCRCTVLELPDVLQHWCLFQKATGNHLINRVDPIEWACQDPWLSLSFRVAVFVSLREMKRIRKNTHPCPVLPGQ